MVSRVFCPTLKTDDEDDYEGYDADNTVSTIAAKNRPTMCITVESEDSDISYTYCDDALEQYGFKMIYSGVNKNTLSNTLKFWYKNGSNKHKAIWDTTCSCCGFHNASDVETIEDYLESIEASHPFTRCVILIKKSIFEELQKTGLVNQLVEITVVDVPYVLFEYFFGDDTELKDIPVFDRENDKYVYFLKKLSVTFSKNLCEELSEYNGAKVGGFYDLRVGGMTYNRCLVTSITRCIHSYLVKYIHKTVYQSYPVEFVLRSDQLSVVRELPKENV